MIIRWSALKSLIETVALVVVAAAVIYTATANRAPRPGAGGRAPSPTAKPTPPLPMEPVSLDGAQTSGSRSAKVALVIYSDFQCPFCARFAQDTLPTLQKQYVETGKLLLAFRQLPLDIHPFAQQAAEGSLCAAQQGRFWSFHDALFADPQSLDATSLQMRANRLGLNTAAFTACLSGQTAAQVEADKGSAQLFGITGTPTFLLGSIVTQGRVKVSERFSGALPIVQFQTRLDSLLRKAGITTNP